MDHFFIMKLDIFYLPGKQESPQRRSPSTGVLRLGNGKGRTPPNRPACGAEVPAAHAIPMFEKFGQFIH